MPSYGNSVWIFVAPGATFPGGIFTSRQSAEAWISLHGLSGTLTRYPVNEGVFEWALRNACTNLKPEKLAQKRLDPAFVGSFTTASQQHYHYDGGKRAGGP